MVRRHIKLLRMHTRVIVRLVVLACTVTHNNILSRIIFITLHSIDYNSILYHAYHARIAIGKVCMCGCIPYIWLDLLLHVSSAFSMSWASVLVAHGRIDQENTLPVML